MKKISEHFLKSLEKMPMSDHCPLIKKPGWKCGKIDKGSEPQCKSVSGYINCPYFQKWFYWNVEKMVAKEIAKERIEQKKKKQKEN